VLKENYTLYRGELSITRDETFTISLTPIIVKKPVVTLLRPENNALVTGTSAELAFKAEFDQAMNCSIYINENNDGFFIYLGSVQVSDASEKLFGVIELENKSYWWKVECVDNNKNTGMSSTWIFKVGGQEPEQQVLPEPTGNFNTYEDWIKEFQQILDDVNRLPKDEKEAADALGVSSIIEDSITSFRNTIRDLDGLRFRTELSDSDKQAEGEEIIKQAEQAYKQTPISVEILSKDAFVEYITPKEIEPLVDQYIEINNISLGMSKKNLLKLINELQQEAVISSKVKTARLTFRDGTQADASIVLREIKAYNITQGSFIMEIIPKDVAESAQDIMSSQDFEVIMQDPIIKFNLLGDTTISYYFEADRDLEQMKKIKTMVMIDPSIISEENKVTGFSVSNIKLPKVKGIVFIALIIMLGGLVFAGVKYDGINTAKCLAYKFYGKKKLHYISVILNEIHDHLDSGNHQKAIELYDEARDAYSELSTIAKNDVYDKITETAGRVQQYCSVVQSQSSVNDITVMVSNIQALLNNGQIADSLEEYKRIESAYTQLNDETRELVHPTLVELCNKIQIGIENTKNLI
jgi:tetratricopeptide (TPR) repeat protein